MAETQLATTKMHGESAEKVAGIHAGATKTSADIASRRADETQRYHLQVAEKDAKQAAARLEADIAKEMKDPTYMANKRAATFTSRGFDPKTKAAAQAAVAEAEAGWKARRQAAKDDLELARSQLSEVNEKLGIKKPQNKGADKQGDLPPLSSFERK